MNFSMCFVSRESAEGGRVIVEVDDKVATVRNIKADSRLDGTWDSREKTVAFSFDYCYWSVDPEDPKYASQEMVFQDLGTSVLSGAFRGYNICLFAYGQTGSGKTYTMMGTPVSYTICFTLRGLFSRKDDYSDQAASCRVKVSFLEIYNERVRDLLKQSDHKKPYTLRVREHPETGPYVQGLSQHLVTDYKQVVELLEEGIAKRITAATHIHNASSRSHAIFTIHYTQAILENNLPSEIASKINLVDLAGSERADPSYCKDRITEGANINKSLVTLGIVISTLAQNSQMFSSCQSINTLTSEGESSHVDSPSTGSVSGTRRPAYIPYRDSILTWLLKDSLGGNSKTIMIATISPASSSYNETMSTLRYASNAKNIINKPRVNEDANVRLIRELREEIDRLKTMLISFELIEQLTKDWTSKWMDRKAIMEEYSVDINKEKAGVTIDSSLPHLMAMDDDILSTGVVLYHLREGTTKIGRSDSDQDQDIVLQGRWIEKDHCVIDNICGIVTLRPVQGAHCTVNGCEVTGSCRLSQGALVVLGKSHKFRFNHPAEAAVLRQRRSVSSEDLALDWLNLDGGCTHSPHYILSSLENREIDAVHEEYQQKLRDQEAFHRKQIQRQQLYVEDLKQQILRGQIKAERELENDQALINQQMQENQQWLINENNRLAALQQQQREFAVQTESALYAEAEVQSSIGQEICPSLLQQNKKRLVQLELLRRYSLKKAERNIRRKKVKFQLERIVKKQKLLEAKQNLEQLEASCWLSEVCVKQPRVLNQNIAVQASRDHPLQKRRRSLGSSSLQHRQHSDDDLNDEKGISFLVQKQLTEKQKASSFRSKKGAERDSNDSAIMPHTSKNYQKMEKLDDSTGQAGCQKQTSKDSCPDHFKEKDEPQTFITGTRMTKAKVPGDLSQPANSYLEQNRAQVSNKKTGMDINGKRRSSSPENFAKEMKKEVVYGNLPSSHLNQTAKNLKRDAGVSKTATDMLGNWQEDDENEISDTDSSYSVDSLSCAYAKAFAEKLKQEDFSRNKCFANPEDSESDDSQMSQDSLVEKENKVKMRNKSQFHKLKAPHQPARLYKSRTEHHLSSLVTSYASHRRLGRVERSFSLDSLGDGEEVPAEDPVEESKSDSSDEVPAEIFWKLQTPTSPTIRTEEDSEPKICDRDTEGTNYDLKLSSSFYLDTKSQPASSNACKQFLKEATVSFVQQERSLDRRLYYGLPVAAQSSCDSKVEIGSPRITVPSSHENLEFQDARLYSLSKPKGWLKKDDLKQSAAEFSFVSGSKQIHSITHLSHSIKEINSAFSSDTSEIPLPETTTAASRVSENGSLNRITEEWTNANENSPLESQDVTSSFVSSVGPSSSFVCISAKPDYYEHSMSNHPEQEQLNELSTYRSTTECTQTFGCLESTSTADCLSLVPGKEEDSLQRIHPELPKDHNLEKAPFISVLPVHVLEQRNGCVDSDLEDDFFRNIEKDDLDDDYNNLTEPKVTDLNTGSASVNSPAAESYTGFAYNMASTQSSAVKQVQFGNHVQLFPRREIPTCCDEGFFLRNLTNQNCSTGSIYELQVLARQGAESAVTLGLLRSGESNLETMQDTDYEQISAEEITVDTDFSSKKVTYKCNPLVLAYSASYDQSATPVELSQKEKICMETSTDSLAEIVTEAPSLRDDEDYEPKDPELSSSNHYEFKSKPVPKNYSPECVLADGPVGCLSQHISEKSTLCADNIKAESSESNSQAVVQKEFVPKYKNLMVNEASYLTVNVNGKDTESFPAAVCESTNNLLPESNSSVFYQPSSKVNLFQSASETENCDKLLEHVTIVKGDYDATSNYTMEVSTTKSCSDIDSNCLCTTCSSKSTGEKNSMYKLTDISVEFDATIPLETKTKNKSLHESREEKEACFESDCPEDILLVEDHVNSELGRVFEYNTNKLATVSQEESMYINKEYKFLRNPETDPEEAIVPYQNTKANTDEEETKLMNSAVNLEKNMLEIKSGQVESLPEYPVPKAQSVTADRSAENFTSISLSQNPNKLIDIVASEVQCEVYTNLCLTHEEAEKDESQVGSTDVEHTQESKALMCSDSYVKTNSFCPKKESEKIEIAVYSPELSVSPQNTPSAVCSHTTDVTQDMLGFLDACEGLLQRNRTIENVFDMEDVAATGLITGRQGNILEKNENEKQVESSNLTEHFIPNCLPHENFDQENKVSECEVTESEEQIIMTNTEGPIIMKQEDICTDKNVLFPEESPALHQVNCDRDDKEEILNQYEIPERYLTASGLEQNMLSVDDSQYCDPIEMSEDHGSVDSATDTRNTVMKDIDVYECSVDDSINIDKYTIGQESKRLHVKEDSHTYMSCSVQYPEHGTSEKLNESIVRKHEICGLDSIGSRVVDEKVHLMNLNQMDKTDRERQMFLENTEEVELIILQNLSELFPENKDGCHNDSRLDEILRESQWVSTSFSGSNEETSKQQNPPATLKSTENIHKDSDKDSLCQSVNQLFYLGVSDNSHVVPDVPTASEGHTKQSNSCAGTGVVLPYYETLVENEVCVSTPGKTVNKEGADTSISDKIQSRNETFLQNRTTLDRQEEEPFVFNSTPNSAPGQPVSENSPSVPYCVGGDESETVALKQGAEENPFSLEKIDSSEDIIQDISNSHEEPSVDLMVNKISKDCFNSIEEQYQEEKDTIMPDSLHLDNSNLLSSSEKEAMEDAGEKAKHSTLEISSQKTFHNINVTETELHSGSLSQRDDKEKCLNTSCSITSSKNDNAGFPGISGYQHEPRGNEGHRTSEECCVDCPESPISENISTLSESLNKSLWENPHSNKELLNYKSNPRLTHSPVSFADFLFDSNGDKCKNDAVLPEETKYFERESTDLSVSVTFPDVSQKGDERNNNSAVTEATDAQNKKIPEEAVGTDQNGKIIQGSFQNCNDTKENKMHEYLEHYSNTSSMTVPESGMLAFQSLGKIGSKEFKCLPTCFAEDAPTDKLFQSSKNVSAFNTCLLDDSKSLIFSHLEDSLQDTILTEQVSSGSADVQSVKEDFPQTCAKVNYPSLTAFSECSSAADIDHGVTGTCGISHTSILKHPPFAVLQMQDTQSDKSVVFDEPVHASGSILLSLAKENRHYPVSDTDSTLYENSTVDVEPIYGSNCQQFDNDNKVDQHHWGKVLAQKACTEHTKKVSGDADSLSLPSLPLWDTGRSILVKEGQMRKILNRNEEQLHSSTEAEQSVVKKKQRKTVNREAERQTRVSSNSTSELIDPQDGTDTYFPGDVNVDPEHMCDSFGPAKSRSSDPRQLYHTVLGFEKSPADLQGNCHYVPTGGANPGQTNTDGRKRILLCKNNADSSIDADADSCSTTGDDTMKNETLKSERLKFSLTNNETNPLKFLTEDHDLPTQESKLVQFRSKRSWSTTQNTNSCKQSEQRPYLQSHRLSAPAIAVFSDLDYTSEASSKVDHLLYSASKSLQDLNMSVEPPSPTEDDLHGIERFSKQESKNFLQVKSKPRFQQRMTQTKKLANCDLKNVHYAARTQSSQTLKDSTVHSPSLLHTAYSSVGAEENTHSKSSSVAQCSEGRVEEAGYQPGTDKSSHNNKDAMHFNSSDINPYIHPWQQDELCKIGWKQYVFGSASDVSCNQMPLNLDSRKVTRCSSVDNGLNSQNSPFHSHLSSYATQYSNVSIETLKTNAENNTAEFVNPSAHPGNSAMQVDEIVLLYPSESERSSKKSPGITCEQGTQTVATARYKRQRRHQRSYTDVSARKQETNRDLLQQHSSWTSMQNLSMHLSQLIQNTSELLGNLSQQNIIDNEQNAKIRQRKTEEGAKAARLDSCTQTTADIGTQTEILEEPQSKHEEKQVQVKMENELRAARAVSGDLEGVGADVGKVPKRKEETLALGERAQEQTEMRNLDNPDFHDSLDSILEDSFMRLPFLPRASTPTLDFQKTSLNTQQNAAFASTRVSSVTSSSLSSGKDDSSCTVVSSPTNSTFQSPASYTQDKRSVNEPEVPVERKLHYKNTLLVDRASSPILTLSASPKSQNEPFGYSGDTLSPLHSQRKKRLGPQSGTEPHMDNFSQTETDSESSTFRDSKGVINTSGGFSDKKAPKKFLGKDGSEDVEQQRRYTVGSLGGIRHENYVGNSDSALIHNYSPPKSDLLFHQKSSATCLSKANINESSEPLVEASSLQFRDFWKNESSCPLLSDVSDVQTSFQDDNTSSVTETECDTEIPVNKNTFVKPYRPRSYSLRDLPIHNKFSNWCGVKGSPPPSLLSLSGRKSQLCDSRSREIERLQRERAQIMSGIHLDLHQHPLSVELTEAKLNYGIGETDALLRVLQSGTADDLMAIPVKQQLYERTIETLRKEREKRLQRYHRSRSLSPQKHFSLLQTLDGSHRDLELPSRRREYLQQLRRDVVENTRVQEPKRRSIQHPSEIELMLRDYQKAREETKTEIARARDKLRERAEQEKRRIREQIFSQLQKEEARLKTLASTSTLCTESSLSLSSGPTSGYNSSNTAAYAASKLSSWDGQVRKNCLVKLMSPNASTVTENKTFFSDGSYSVAAIKQGKFVSTMYNLYNFILPVHLSLFSKVMAACSQNLRNLYTCQAAGGWKYQCTEKEVLVYYKVFPSATKHGFLGAGVIERPLPSVWGLVRDPGKRHLYDRTINTARIHKKVTSHIQLVYLVTDTSLCYLKQPRDFCCITVEAKEENLSVLAIQSVYDASMPHPCKDMVRGEILPSAWILEPDVVNGREITRVIYMAQVDLGAPAIPARLLSSLAKRQPLVIARLAHFLAS
uniref:StAR-related lipid transfer protein 9 n=1 Tax=Anser cygnoides TaxID=8845 RepID=A0A8B9DW12_ANSCY